MPFLSKLSRIFPKFLRRRKKAPVAVDLASLEKLIGHRFKNPALLQTALTHPSFTATRKPSVPRGVAANVAAQAAAAALPRTSVPASPPPIETRTTSAPVSRTAAKLAKAEAKLARAAAKVAAKAAAKLAKAAKKARAGHTEPHNNQRLEFLGDAVLNLVLAEALYAGTDADEGLLTDARSRVSCGKHLARVGRELGLGRLLQIANNGDTAKIRESDTANEDALEALFGAIFLDGGLKAARKLAHRLFSTDLSFDGARVEQGRSAKNRLQELVQRDGRPNDGKRIEYRATATTAAAAADTAQTGGFSVEVFVDGVFRGRGEGRTKRAASELAAAAALAVLVARAK